ncbi:GntR family transcriptional regulator [Massilia cavernae]|nr:GntR family transcriptional regulator [Massilia cavernae]
MDQFTFPSRYGSQTEHALLGIRGLVLGGCFDSGERLVETVLAEQFQVRPAAIAAALRQLQDEGMVEPAPAAGYAVCPASAPDLNEAVCLRGRLEGLAARMAAERGVAQEILDAMRECLVRIDRLLAMTPVPSEQVLTKYMFLNARFHALLLDASDSIIVRRAFSRALALPFSSPSAFVLTQADNPDTFASLATAQLQHHGIVDAIAARDSVLACELSIAHAGTAHRNLVAAKQCQRCLVAALDPNFKI